MAILSFELESSRACRGGDPDFYGSIQSLAARRTLVATKPLWLNPQLLRQGNRHSMTKVARDTITTEGIKLDRVAAVSFYRFCREHAGGPRAERLAVLAIQHVGAEITEVEKTMLPVVNEHSVGTLVPKPAMPGAGHLHPVYCPPIMAEEARIYPITHVLSLPVVRFIGGEAYTALRDGTLETLVPVDELRPPSPNR